MNLNPHTQKALKKQQAFSILSSIIIALLSVILLGLFLFLLKVLIPSKAVETIITYNAPTEVAEEVIKEKVVPVSRSKPTPPSAASSAVNVITSTAPTAISIPDSEVESFVESIEFGEADDFGASVGSFDGAGSAGAGFMTAFGRTGGGGLKGKLYDVKQSTRQDNRAGGYSIQSFQARTEKARDQLYESSTLREFYKAKSSLSFSYLAIDTSPATIGPESFQAADEIKPSAWIVVYEGTLAEDAKRQIRLYGKFDDILIVYINDEMVLDASWSPGYTAEGQSKGIIEGAPRRAYFGCSDYLSLKEGDKIRIVVGEVPGGQMGGGLYVEERGVENPGVRRDGVFTLIPFSTLSLSKEDQDILKSKKLPMEVRDVPVFPVTE